MKVSYFANQQSQNSVLSAAIASAELTETLHFGK